MTGQRTYSQLAELRKSTVHWVGDRQGNISAPAFSHYSNEILGYDIFNGVYAYGGTGGQVTLTLSSGVQMAALEAMGSYKGTLAVYNYKTGEILCAVSTPTFDPDNPPTITEENASEYEGVYMNRFVQSTYTPGSIFKIVTAAAALETIPDIQQKTYTAEKAYNYFCKELENVLGYVFERQSELKDAGSENTDEKIMLRNTIITVAHKVYLDKLFTALRTQEASAR